MNDQHLAVGNDRGIAPVMARSLRMVLCVLALGVAAGCTVIPRLDANFNADSLGIPPSTPTPSPPNDSMNWRTGFVSASVVTASSGRTVRIAALPAFTSSPDNRQVFVIAVTEPFSPMANIRGRVNLRLNGLGIIGFGLRPLQGEQTLDYIGGFELGNFLAPAKGSVDALRSFKGDAITGFASLPANGSISGYQSGSNIVINWTIDQPSHTFSASILGGVWRSAVFPDISGSVATTPLQRLEVVLWMQRPTTDTVAFIDDLIVEEYR